MSGGWRCLSQQSIMTTPVTSTIVLTLVCLVQGSQKKAASCDIDSSIPCECTNPFLAPTTSSLATPSRTARLPRPVMSRTCQDVLMPDRPEGEAGASPSWLVVGLRLPQQALLSHQARWSHHQGQNVHQLEAPGSASARFRASAAATSVRWTASLTATIRAARVGSASQSLRARKIFYSRLIA